MQPCVTASGRAHSRERLVFLSECSRLPRGACEFFPSELQRARLFLTTFVATLRQTQSRRRARRVAAKYLRERVQTDAPRQPRNRKSFPPTRAIDRSPS